MNSFVIQNELLSFLRTHDALFLAKYVVYTLNAIFRSAMLTYEQTTRRELQQNSNDIYVWV